MPIEVRIAQFFRQVGWINHTSRRWDMRKKLIELRQTEGAEHRLDLLGSGRNIMTGGLARQSRGVIGQGRQGRMAHISPGYTLMSTSLTARVSERGTHPSLSWVAGSCTVQATPGVNPSVCSRACKSGSAARRNSATAGSAIRNAADTTEPCTAASMRNGPRAERSSDRA